MKILSVKPELTFDDVLLLPNKSTFPTAEEEKKIDLRTKIARELTLDIPLVSSPMPGVTEAEMAIALGRSGGLGFIHPFQSFERQFDAVRQVKREQLKVAACISDIFSKAIYKHVESLLRLGADLISIESLNADNTQVINFVKSLKKKFPKISLSVSLVVTAEATEALIRAGADSIRVGIGGGSHCTTRLLTGVGRPQLSAVYACARISQKHHIPLISDTGIKYAGDVAKAIAFGADAVMIGGLFSGTDECPGPIISQSGRKFKYSWGMCTETAMAHREPEVFFTNRLTARLKQGLYRLLGQAAPSPQKTKQLEEGVGGLIPYKGSVAAVLQELVSGLRRSLWYQGVTNLQQLKAQARVVVVSANTQLENLPRI